MNRPAFVTSALATLIAGGARPAGAQPHTLNGATPLRSGSRWSLAHLLAAYPEPRSGDLLQYELGFGAAYDKQIGFGHEMDGDDRLSFVETQVGNGDHACNPNTLKKVYLKGRAFANVFTPYSALSYVTRSGNMLTRWGDGVGPEATNLLLLDAKALYDPRSATIGHTGPARLTVDGQPIETTHIVAHYPSAAGQQLRTVELWLSPAVPLGLVKMTATAPDVDPFHLTVYKFARHFKTELAMSLTTIRALTPTGDVPVLQ